jgi:glucose-1-phosphate adenylyltransferase
MRIFGRLGYLEKQHGILRWGIHKLMPVNDAVLALILGGGQGARLFPLTQYRSKPAVPIGGGYRLIDIPISNCLNADIRRIFILTQFNSASLNRHIAQTYRMDQFSQGFVDILAAEQTPDNPEWFQGTADAVRQAERHFARYDADYYLILAGDHLYRMDYNSLIAAHADSRADITIAAQPVASEDASAMGIFRFDTKGQIVGFEEKPRADRLNQVGQSIPANAAFAKHIPAKPFVASMGIYVFSRDVLLEILHSGSATDFGREIIPQALDRYSVKSHLFDGYWADVGTVDSFYAANIMLTQPDAPFTFYDPHRPIFTEPRLLPGSRLLDGVVRQAIIAEGCFLERCVVEKSVVGIRTNIQEGAHISRSVLLGADFYEVDQAASRCDPRLGIGRGVVLDRVIVDKNARIGDGARLVNAQGHFNYDGKGFFIRSGIIVVPKNATIAAGTTL